MMVTQMPVTPPSRERATLEYDKRETRIFANATAETQVSIKEMYQAASRDKSLPDVPQPESGFLEVFPKVASRPPRLLQNLEYMLNERSRLNDKAVSTSAVLSRRRDTHLSSNLTLDANRQVLASFIEGFSSYSGFLSRIQAEFDHALNEGVRCSVENLQMRGQIQEEQQQKVAAVAAVRAEVAAAEASYRKAAHGRLVDARERFTRAQRRAELAEAALAETRKELDALAAEMSRQRELQRRLQELVHAEDRWAARPEAPLLAGRKIGPMTREDELFLDNELGSGGVVRTQQTALSMPVATTGTEAPLEGMGTLPLAPSSGAFLNADLPDAVLGSSES